MQTIAELAGERGLEKFHAEFSKLFYALKRVHENERRLTQKCRQLNDEIAANVSKVSAALEMTQEDGMANNMVRQVNWYYNQNNFIQLNELMFTILYDCCCFDVRCLCVAF